MKRLKRFLLWTILFLALLVAADQLLVTVPLHAPGLNEIQQFYLDFRSRLFGLVEGQTPSSIDQVIERAAEPAPAAPAVGKPKPQRYLYVDDQGELQFADSLAEVPAAYRSKAQPLKE